MKNKQSNALFALLGIALVFASGSNHAVEGYYRYPSLTDSTLVFSAEGDLWRTDLNSAEPHSATRLTTHPSLETQALISPDGRQVAFIANYDGVNEIYTMSIDGGVPDRLTFEHASVRLQHWVDDEHLLYSTNSRPGAPSNWTLKVIDVESKALDVIPIADALSGALHKQGKRRTLFFVQFGIQMASDNTNFYRGGMRGRLWKYELDGTQEATPFLASHEGNIRDPMLSGERLYFVSDADGRDNIWSTDLEGGDLKQVTRYDDLSVREVSVAYQSEQKAGVLVLRRGADLERLDLGTESRSTPNSLDIEIQSDHPEVRARWIKKPLKYLTSVNYASEQNKVLLTARGKMAIVGTDQTRLVTVNTPTRSRNRGGVLGVNGDWVYALSDQSGELELWRFAADGSDTAEQLTDDGAGHKENLQLSHDGEWLTYIDEQRGLWLYNIDTGKRQTIVSESHGFEAVGPVAWAPDGNHLAVAQTPLTGIRPQILLYSVADGRKTYVTSGKYISRAPRFSADGKWLYYLSERNFSPNPTHPWFDRDFGASFDKRSVVLANALTEDIDFPFAPDTELTPDKEDNETEDEGNGEKDTTTSVEVEIQWEGLSERLFQAPLPADNYLRIELNEERMYLLTEKTGADQPVLQTTKIETNPKVKTFTKDVATMSLSNDGKHILVVKGEPEKDNIQILIVPAAEKFPKKLDNQVVKAKDWQFLINPKDEWDQIFHDAWFMHREFFFDPDLRGVNWLKVKKKYEPLVARATARDEINDVFKQMMAELNALHSQVRDGDKPEDPNATKPGILGAVLENNLKGRRPAGVKIHRIFGYDNELPLTAPPLARTEVDAQAGDIITAVNGNNIEDLAGLYSALQNQVGKQVLLDLLRNKKAIQTVVVPSDHSAERQYRYQDWVSSNRAKVTQLDTRIGYLHLQSMVGRDVGSFANEFYADQNKQGMIIDVRRNNGGNVDSWLINHLMRQAWMFWQPRNGTPYVNMQRAFRGHLVVLADERTYSDGETFTAAIKHFGIADVIGRQTAGAGVWLNNRNRQSDGGLARVAQSPVFDLQGNWVVEGRGVSPTIEVVNYPNATFNGQDSQLEAAIEYLQEKIANEPIAPLQPKPFPDALAPGKDVPGQ